MKPFDGFDLADSDECTSPGEAKPEMVMKVEHKLGFRLPASYVALLETRNGGTPVNTCFPTSAPTSWAEDHIMISGIKGIGGQWGIDAIEFGSAVMIAEWGYPDIGIVCCECPSAGHDVVMLDYSECGRDGEPRVVHVETETADAPDITLLAPDFETFIRGLVHEDVYDTSTEELARAKEAIRAGRLSTALSAICSGPRAPAAMENIIRNLCFAIAEEKGYFALHADDRSMLLYDILFDLHTVHHGATTWEAYLEAYRSFIAFGDGELTTGGYAPGFVEDWFDAKSKGGQMEEVGGLRLTAAYRAAVHESATAYQG